MKTHREKALAFRALHERDTLFAMPNPWDIGSAVMLEKLGFEAIATSSAALAFSHGQRDTKMGAEASLAHASLLAASVDLPVSGDLENGYDDAPENVAHTIRQASYAGLCGGSIEDACGDTAAPIYPLDFAIARVHAAARAAATLETPFVLTARAENYLHGRDDLADTIERLQAYAAAGADVVYAPGVIEIADIARIVRAVDKPVNVLVSSPAQRYDLRALRNVGVRRVTLGSALYGTVMGAFLRAARELRDDGTFSFLDGAAAFGELSDFF